MTAVLCNGTGGVAIMPPPLLLPDKLSTRAKCVCRVEVGIHGFWRSYRNIDRLVSQELELDARRVFTRYERSALHTKVRIS